MRQDELLYEYVVKRLWELTEEWYESIPADQKDEVYLSKNPDMVKYLKEQNHAFHNQFAKVFINPKKDFLELFEEWMLKTIHDDGYLETPSHVIIEEFGRAQRQYLKLVDDFFITCESCTLQDMNRWRDQVLEGMGTAASWFLKAQHEYEVRKSREQQHIINKLSSPIISLNKHIALLPLIGNIDEDRAAFMLENTLELCSSKNVRRLLIDLSGVVMVNTMVAHQIFQLIDALALIGVDTTLSGIRPEIAQTAVEFGDRFSRMTIVTDLEKAIDMYLT